MKENISVWVLNEQSSYKVCRVNINSKVQMTKDLVAIFSFHKQWACKAAELRTSEPDLVINSGSKGLASLHSCLCSQITHQQVVF